VVIGDTATTTDILNLDVASGGPTIDVGTGAGVVFMYANVTGSQGFTKTGAGTLTFRFNPHNMAYTGTVTLNQGTLGLNQDGSLGDTSNPLSVTGNSTLLIAPGSNSGTVAFAAGRTMTIASSVTSTVQNNNAAQTVVFNNPIGGSGALALNTGTFTLNGNNTYAGATTLTNVNRLTLGNGSRISSAGLTVTTPVAATFGTVIDLGGNAQSVSSLAFTTGTSRVTSTITNGSLNVTGGNLTLNSGTTAAATGTQTYDLSGLSAFTYNNAAGTFAATVSATTASLTGQTRVNLANAGNSGTNTITALNVNIGNSSSNNATNSTVIGLGKFNTFNSGTMQVGFFQGSGTMGFQSGVSNGVLTLRGTAGGSSSMDTLTVGYNNSGNRTGQGTLNLAGGTLDARVNTLNVGFSLQSIANSSSLVMGSGTVVAGLLNLGGGNNLSTATFTQSQGDVTAGSLLFGGTASAGTPHYSLTYNLNGGSLRSGTIATNLGTFSSTTSRTIAWTAGTIANYDASTDLTINGTTGAGGALTLSLGGAGTKTLAADLGRTITFGANALISSTGALTVNGAGTVVINGSNSYSGDTSLSAGTLRTGNANALGTGAITVASGATLDLNSLAVPNTITNNGGTVTNAASYAGSQSLSGSSSFGALGGTVTVNSGGIANFAGAMTGGVTVNTGGVANVAAGGSVAGILTLAGGGLTGVGTVGVISGTGLVGPGNSPGIMTSTGSLDPTGGADFAFEFTGAVPTWSTGTASVNDVLRLTAAAPITSALTSGNVINVYLNAGSLTAGNTFLGGLFIDQTQGSVDLAPLVANATFAYFVAGGTDATYNTIGYSTLANYMAANPGITGITPSTVTVASADFSGNTITNGQTLQFAIVPEPGAMTLVACGAAVAAWAAARRHRRR
jgi:autotransporter-associated beta strand protein